uniref:Secreted protein n=1 Tax=Globodera pallida TaxID=36090 RepID=A0A183CDG1_GLOPA
MFAWWRLLLLYGIGINLGIYEPVSTALDINGSNASHVNGLKGLDINGSNASGINGSNTSEKNSFTASDVNDFTASDMNDAIVEYESVVTRRGRQKRDGNLSVWAEVAKYFRQPTIPPPLPSSSCYVALRHRDYPPPSELLDKMNHWGSDDFKEGKTHVARRCTNIPECQTFRCKEKGKHVFVVNACGQPGGGCDDYIAKLCKGAGECDSCTNEKEDSLCNKDKLEFYPKKTPENTTAVSGAGVALHSSILFALLPICVVMWM